MNTKKRILSAVLGLLCTASLTAAPFSAMAEEITASADAEAVSTLHTSADETAPLPSGMEVTNGSVPADTLPTNAVFSVRGLISSSYLLTNVRGGVYREDGTATEVYYEDEPLVNAYDLNATFDNYLNFGVLTPGNYVYRIEATDDQGTTAVVLEKAFTVTDEQAPSAIDVYDESYPTGNIREGAGFGIQGTIRSTYALQSVTGGLYALNGEEITPTAFAFTVDDIGKKGFNLNQFDAGMEFNKLPAGTYVYKVEATDVNGFTKLLVYSPFVISSIDKTVDSAPVVMKGIDISSEQGEVDFAKLYADGVDFVILRAAFTDKNSAELQKDECFDTYYEQAKAAGLKVGAYLYTSAFNSSEMESNVRDYLAVLDGKSLDLPAYIDVETSRQSPLGKAGLTELVKQGCSAVREAGFQAGVYSSMKWFTNYIDADVLREAESELWVAYYPDDPDTVDLSDFCVTWQYCSNGTADGVSGEIHRDYRYDGLSEEAFSITITQPEGAVIKADKETAVSGERVTVTAELDRRHKLQKVFFNGTETAVSRDGIFSFIMPEGDVEITVELEECDPSETGLLFASLRNMPVPFGTAGDSAPYHAKPCNERLATLPEALMKLTEDGYSWSGAYGEGKPAWALTLMDYANIYSYIHTHEINEATLRAVLADGDSMLHKTPFTAEEIDLLLGDDEAAAMAAFASPSTIVIGKNGYCAKWMYYHTAEDYAAEGITPEMVAAVQKNYYNPLYVQEAADAFSQKLFQYSSVLTQTKCQQWVAGDLNRDGAVNAEDISALQGYLDFESYLTFTEFAAADMNGDSKVDADDLPLLQEKAQAGAPDTRSVSLNVMEYCQYPDYPTGCESVSLFMLLQYYGVNVTVDNIYDLLPMGTQPYDDEAGVRHGANPEREFVGDPRSSYSYGVFNDPIADVASQIRAGVRTKRGASIDDIKAILDTGNPVLAWYVSAPMRQIMYRWSWVDERGDMVGWPGGEHAVVICGYDDETLTYRDPNAGTTVIIDYDTFAKSFTELGSRIVYYTDGAEDPAGGTLVTDNSAEYYAPVKRLCEMAVKDYEVRTGVQAVSAKAEKLDDGTLYMTLIGDKDSVIESYVIDPKTGTGTDSKDNAVNLPQTGNNALTNALLTFGAFLTTIAGGIAVGASGVFRRRKDRE